MRSHLTTLAILASVLLVLLLSPAVTKGLTEEKSVEAAPILTQEEGYDDEGYEDYTSGLEENEGDYPPRQEYGGGSLQPPYPGGAPPPLPSSYGPQIPLPPPYNPAGSPIENAYYQPLYDVNNQASSYQPYQQLNYSAPLVYPPSFDLYQQVPPPSYPGGNAQVVYQQPIQPVYQPLVQPVYQPPVQPVYQSPPIVSNYSAQPSYQPIPLPVYSPPQTYQQAPVVNYSVQPSYQPVQVPVLTQPATTYVAAPVTTNYSPAVPQVKYQPVVQSNYSQPVPAPVQQQNYVQQPNYVQQQPISKGANYSVAVIQPVGPILSYNLAELAPFIPLSNYRSNHWSLFYYRASPYRQCPKNVYLNPPTSRDIELAFAFAQQQLSLSRGSTINYLNSTSQQLGGSAWAGRHQIFSFLNQQSARMDEEGLLIELVSQYLSDRACLTKWDKQRYLPQLTKFISTTQFPGTHSCSNHYQSLQHWSGPNKLQYCLQSKYRTFDGFCNNPYHPYWGKANVCHIRLLSPDYADGISAPRNSYNLKYPLPNPRLISNYIHFELPIESPYNLMKMQWGQFINHDITNTALSSYDGLVDCCRNPQIRGCWPIYIPPGDKFYSHLNVTCLSFIRSGVCPLCELGPRQQINKNTAFLDASHVYGNNQEQALKLRLFRNGLMKFSEGKNNEILLPIANSQEQQCAGVCFEAGDNRVNQHPTLTALHTLLLRNHNHHARQLYIRHPNWTDEILFQEARRINIAEYQMITYAEYLPIVFGPILSAYYKFLPQRGNNLFTYYEPKADPTTWNEYSTASCRFGHSQIPSTFGLYGKILGYMQQQDKKGDFRLKDWFMRPSFLSDGLMKPLINGLLDKPSEAVDPWITNDVRNHLYQSHKDLSGGDLAATNIWRGRDHGIPGYVHYVEYCFNHKVRSWRDLQMFIPYYTLNQLKKLYVKPENIDLFVGGLAERHFPGADIGPTFACINGIQYYHMKFGDRYWFEHANQAGSFTPYQLDEIKRTTLARLLCRTAYLPAVPQYAFLQPSIYNPLINCNQVGEIDYNKF